VAVDPTEAVRILDFIAVANFLDVNQNPHTAIGNAATE